MPILTKHRSLFVLTLSSISLFSFTALQDSPGEEIAKMEQLGEYLAEPDKHHEYFKHFVGNWTTESSVFGLEPTQGTASNNLILGNRFLDSSYSGTIMGSAYDGKMTLGYDKYKRKYVATFIDSLGTSIKYAEGLLDKSNQILSLWGPMDEWMTGEHDKVVLYRFTVQNENQFTLEIHDLAMYPDDAKVIEIVYKRSQ